MLRDFSLLLIRAHSPNDPFLPISVRFELGPLSYNSTARTPNVSCPPASHSLEMTLALPIFHASEGLTIDSLYRFLKLLLKPTVALLYPLAVLASHREELSRRGWIGLEDVWLGDWRIKAAIGVLGVSLVMKVNDWLSARARNNWAKDPSWDWEKEVVLVTGGELEISSHLVTSAYFPLNRIQRNRALSRRQALAKRHQGRCAGHRRACPTSS